MISPRRINPRSEYSIFVPGSAMSGVDTTRARIASAAFRRFEVVLMRRKAGIVQQEHT